MSPTEKSIRILVIDDNPILLEGIVLLVSDQPDMETVGAALTADVGLALFIEKRPNITLVDLELPRSIALELVKQMRTANPQAKILVLASYELDGPATAALAAGATAVIGKDRIPDGLPDLIRNSFRAVGLH
ncbi:MAG TPA: response regulator transcription factor [Bryobacteraceae bacterium]|nr:response regulator transcription factor [Bryobacteraceae bacterium]